MFNHYKAIAILLKFKAKIDITDFSGITPLHLTCWFGCYESCSALLDAGAPVNVQDISGRTPFYFAVLHNRVKIVPLMLSHDANPKIKDINGINAESLAIDEGNVDIVDMIQKHNQENRKKTDSSDNSHGSLNSNDDWIAFEKDFYEEHNKMKIVINKLIESRDKQYEEYQFLKDRIEDHDSSMKMIFENQSEMIDTLQHINSSLNSISARVNTITNTSAQSSQINIRSPPPKTMCKLCGKNPATFRCKNCRSPYCDVCMKEVIQKGCKFCSNTTKS